MGEVYRARDPKIGRDVALKVLHRRYARKEDLARFSREARAAGSLNHPNILAVGCREKLESTRLG
jgi:serine/threonine-protein kinase